MNPSTETPTREELLANNAALHSSLMTAYGVIARQAMQVIAPPEERKVFITEADMNYTFMVMDSWLENEKLKGNNPMDQAQNLDDLMAKALKYEEEMKAKEAKHEN